MINLVEHESIKKYKEIMTRMMKLYYPDLTIPDIEAAVEYSINKRYKQEICILNNNYTNKKAQTTLMEMVDYIMDKEPIITAWGVMFNKKGTVPNPLCNMIKNFMDLRGIHKSQMFQFPKGSEDFEHYNLIQILDKLDANGTYGVIGLYSSVYYNLHVAATVTTQGRSLISASTMNFEMFLSNNVKFGSLDQVITFIDNICQEKKSRKFYDSVILDRNIGPDEVFAKVIMTCGFQWIPTEKEMDIIWNLISKLNQENLNRVYYKNNLYEFISNKCMIKAMRSLLKNLEAPFMDPNEAPEEIKDELDAFTELLMEYVYYPHMTIDNIDRCDNMMKSVCAISDTDSAIVSLDAWYRFFLEKFMGEDFNILHEKVDYITWFDTNDVKKSTFISPIELELDYDFYNDTTIERNRTVNVCETIPQDNLRFSIINILAYVLDKISNDYMIRFTKNANSYEENVKCLIILKNEFLFKRALLTNAKKNYSTLQELQEGKIVPYDEQLDLKGLAIDKSTMNMSTRKELKKILLEDILRVDTIDQVAVIKKLAIMEDIIYKSLSSGDKSYYKPLTVKSYESYKNPLRIQGIKASIAWNALRGELEALDMTSRNVIDVVKVEINPNTAERIKDTYPEVYRNIIELVGTKDTPSTNKLYREAFKGNITGIAIPKDVQVPKWVVEFIDYKAIINDNLCNFPLESIGLRNLGKDKVNYSNILKL